MRNMKKSVETVNLTMLEDRVVYSEPRFVGDTLDVQQPLAGLLIKRGAAEPTPKAKTKGGKSS